MYFNTGEPLRPILPVYSKNDRRPELSAIAFDKQGRIYVADKANHRIQKFSFDGNFLCFIGSSEDLHRPMGIVATMAGDVIVSEFDRHCLKVFSREGLVHSRTIGAMGIGIGKFVHPRGLALDRQENIVIADSHNHRVHVVSSDGEYVGAFGTIGGDPGCLDTPYDVAVDACGNVIVADTKNHRIQTFTRLVPIYAEPAAYDEENDAMLEEGEEDRDTEGEEFEENRIENEDFVGEEGDNLGDRSGEKISSQISGDGKEKVGVHVDSLKNAHEKEKHDDNNNSVQHEVNM